MPEDFADQLDRLRLMTADDRGRKWDLSPNDRAAIGAVLNACGGFMEDNERLRRLLFHRLCDCDQAIVMPSPLDPTEHYVDCGYREEMIGPYVEEER